MDEASMIQIPLHEYEKSVLEKDNSRKRIEYLEYIRADDIKTIRELRDNIERMESAMSYTGNPIEQFMLNNKLSLGCPFSIIYDDEGFGGGYDNSDPEIDLYQFYSGYTFGNPFFELVNCTIGERNNEMLGSLLNGERLIHKRL